MTGGRPVAEKYLQSMTEVKNGRMSTAWRLLPHKRAWSHAFPRPSNPGIVALCRLSGSNRGPESNVAMCSSASCTTIRTTVSPALPVDANLG